MQQQQQEENHLPAAVTLREFVEQWQVLTKRQADVTRQTNTDPHAEARISDMSNDATTTDPFDCQDMASPSIFEKVDKLLPSFVEAWRDLDRRKISASAEGGNRNDDDDNNNTNPRKHSNSDTNNSCTQPQKKLRKKNPFWFDKHVRLPEQFDYTNQGEPPPELPETADEDRVVSLLDPTRPTSYQHELWHLFDTVPTSLQLMKMQDESNSGDNDGESSSSLCLTRAVYDTLVQQWAANSATKHAQLTANFGLHALRQRDRHDIVACHDDDGSDHDCSLVNPEGTLTLELWRNPHSETTPPTPDAACMVLEFRGSQTLQDVHQAIVELTGDRVFWKQVVRQTNNKKKDTLSSFAEAASQDKPTATTAESASAQQVVENTKGTEIDSGFLFSEGTFYTVGSVDYVKPIQAWLQPGDDELKRSARGLHLGIDSIGSHPTKSQLPVKPMSEMSLRDWPVRLGRRYVHVHHGTIECSLFVVDLQCCRPPQQHVQYPILHDIWVPPLKHPPDCAACQKRAATLVTQTTCDMANGHKALCQVCARQLRIPHKGLQSLTVWNGI